MAAGQIASSESDAVLVELQRLAASERRDVSVAIEEIRAKQRVAQNLALSGQTEVAVAADRDATRAAVKALNALVDNLVHRYTTLASQATSSNELGIAQEALDRAKKINSLRH